MWIIVELKTLSQIAKILGGIAVVVAIFFGIAQIKQQRFDATAIEIMRSLQDRH